ncbi:hypothetical protein BV20DRAFT_1049872 [Pilatotrama ljubarskyi]|nr:hypothetical protein BV20DRAFT_1049872 [Pilatotrama ljubarskyi]
MFYATNSSVDRARLAHLIFGDTPMRAAAYKSAGVLRRAGSKAGLTYQPDIR